jgi:heat shock protein HtpX
MVAYGLYSHIRANRIRSVVLIAALFLLVYLMSFAGGLIAAAFAVGDQPLDYLIKVAGEYFLHSLPIVTIGALIWLWIAWRFHQRIIDALVKGHEVTRQEEPRLYNLLENLCIARGIQIPKLKIAEDPALNAFATGLNQKQYAITVTRGLMQRLDKPELEAVLGHELTHIRNGDVRMLVIAVVIAGVVSFFGELVFRGLFRGGVHVPSGSSDDRRGGRAIAIMIALAIVVIAWLLSIVIRLSLSRTREYLADAGAVELTKNPDAMITALRKIEGRGELETATASVMEMCVDNPHSGFVDFFSTHPTIQKRVAAIVQTAGGRDPGPIHSLVPSEHLSNHLREGSARTDEPPPWGEIGAWDHRPALGTNPLPPWQWGPEGPRNWWARWQRGQNG